MTARCPASTGSGWHGFRLVALALIFIMVACTTTPGGQPASTAPASPTGPAARPTEAITPAERSTLTGIVAYSTRQGDIWVMNANGTGRRRITRSGGGFDFDPQLSPDGRSIVFRTSRGRYLPDTRGIGLEGILVVDVRTGREHPVHPPHGGLFPSWSPDGRAIGFSTLQRDLNGESIHLVTPAGANLRDLAEPAFDAVQEGHAWSPDSRRLAYSGHSGDGNWAIWTMNRDGSHRRQLTFPKLVFPRGSGGDHIGAWSPDGKQIVYSSWQSGDFDLFVMNADGSHVRQLTDWPRGDGAATWLRSGQIVFSHFSGDEPLPRWYLINADGTNLRSLPWFYGAGDPLDWVQPR